MKWRPISEVQPGVDEILAFDPDDVERIAVAFRCDGGPWLRWDGEGAIPLRPTLFCLIEPPDGEPSKPII